MHELCAADNTGCLELESAGHWLVLCPLQGMVEVDSRCIDTDHYMHLLCEPEAPSLEGRASTYTARILLCFVSPAFVGEMAEFLGIPGEFSILLDRYPLPKGDDLSEYLLGLAATDDPEVADEIFMDVVGQILSLQRTRHAALQRINTKKRMTQVHLVHRLCVARQFMDARFLSDLSTSDVARAATISEYHLSRLFRTAFGLSVYQYLVRRRMHFARAQLGGTQISVTEIAGQTGYNSLSAVISAFRKTYGATPSAYRASLQISRK